MPVDVLLPPVDLELSAGDGFPFKGGGHDRVCQVLVAEWLTLCAAIGDLGSCQLGRIWKTGLPVPGVSGEPLEGVQEHHGSPYPRAGPLPPSTSPHTWKNVLHSSSIMAKSRCRMLNLRQSE